MSRILKLRGEDGRWLEVPAIKGSTGATFTPSISSDGILSWSNNKGLTNPPPVSIKGPVGDDGRDGFTYTPHMSETGDLTWTNNNGLPNPDPINLRGPNGIWIEPTEPPDGYDVWIIIDAESSGSGSTEEVLAELLDARVGYDGTTYNSVGSAIRTQINEIYRVLGEYSVSVDATLTSEGIPADAKATGDSIRETSRLASEALNGLRDETNRALDSLDKSKQPKGEYLMRESDPTVPEWAKSETKPTYTAQEVGARPDTWTPTARDVGAVTQSNEGSEATIRLPQTPMLTGANEPFYPLTHASQVVKTDGSRLEQDGRIHSDTASTADKLGGKAPEYYVQPVNLLDNSDFRNPVNQRGQNSYTLAWGMSIDRWYLGHTGQANGGTSTLNIVDGGIELVNNNPSLGNITMQARVPPESLNQNANHTVAWCDSENHISTYIATSEWIQSSINTFGFLAITIESSAPKVQLKWAALYEGSYTAETLPPYMPKGYAAELAECRRYYIQSWTGAAPNLNGVIAAPAMSKTRMQPTRFPQMMRTIPTVTIYSSSNKANTIQVWSTDTEVGGITVTYVTNESFMAANDNITLEKNEYYYYHYAANADL